MDIWSIISFLILSLMLGSADSVRISKLPENVTALRGESATLTCEVIELGRSDFVFWKKVSSTGFPEVLSYNNVSMDDAKYTVHGTYVLTVHHVTLGDEAGYECQAGTDRARAYIRVAVMFQGMELTQQANISLKPSPLVNLTCHVTYSRPPAEIQWFYGSEELTEEATSSDRNLNTNGVGDAYSTLSVSLSDKADNLPYTCKASLPGLPSTSRTLEKYPDSAWLLSSSSSTTYWSTASVAVLGALSSINAFSL